MLESAKGGRTTTRLDHFFIGLGAKIQALFTKRHCMLFVAVEDPTAEQRNRMVNGTITALKRSYKNHIGFEIVFPVEGGRQFVFFQKLTFVAYLK